MNPDRFIKGLSGHLEPPVRKHLKNVYSAVSISTLLAGAGSAVHLYTGLLSGGLLSALASLGFMGALMFTPDDGKNTAKRLGLLGGFAFCTGLGLGPLLELSLFINTSLVTTAFLLSSAIFVSFSLAALYTQRAQFLFLGGILGSALSTMMLLSLANLFFRSRLIFQLELYGGLVLFCGFILYDTQLIIERRRRGDKDYVWHSLMLFVDFVDVFRHVLVILMQKEERNKKKN
ncbi:bax inhibitor 1-like [Amphibalanus amphitrite]|uniref:bax inhibitor 1-like n=1 Tax=Amphibalanus amphitrite TaxID=1232801 RepID=UPI001C906A24|nr:bax inhibitor 1-like [Amphibalanus amphitrite]XP_043218551.1 bax inhibitor 1-like [Amphibalanus amphitrite]